MNKKWSNEEIQFLKFAYPNKEFTREEIYKALEPRTKNAIHKKANQLGLKIYKEIIPEGFRRCCICRNILPFKDFRKNKNFKNGISYDCKSCYKKYKKEYDKKIKKIEDIVNEDIVNEDIVKVKKCIKCNVEKPLTQFTSNKKTKDGKTSYCKECRSKYDRKRRILGGYK